MSDLQQERPAVASVIREMALEPVWAEQLGAQDASPREECERLARECDVYLGIYSRSYGYTLPAPDSHLSATRFEWQMAKAEGKPMLIYHRKGSSDPQQQSFIRDVLDWQRGNFSYAFETIEDLTPHVRDDLSMLIAANFHPTALDERFQVKLRVCLENLGYEVTANQFVGAAQVPILAVRRGLVFPQTLFIGWQPRHLHDMLAAAQRQQHGIPIYIVEGDPPADLLRFQDSIQAISLTNLVRLAGSIPAEAQLRRAATEYKLQRTNTLMDWQQFERVSEHRRQLWLRIPAIVNGVSGDRDRRFRSSRSRIGAK